MSGHKVVIACPQVEDGDHFQIFLFLPQIRRKLPSFAQALRLSRPMEFIRGGGCGFMGVAHPQKLGLIGIRKVNSARSHKALNFPLKCSIEVLCDTIPDTTSNNFFSCPDYSLLCFIVLNLKKKKSNFLCLCYIA